MTDPLHTVAAAHWLADCFMATNKSCVHLGKLPYWDLTSWLHLHHLHEIWEPLTTHPVHHCVPGRTACHALEGPKGVLSLRSSYSKVMLHLYMIMHISLVTCAWRQTVPKMTANIFFLHAGRKWKRSSCYFLCRTFWQKKNALKQSDLLW